MTTTPPKSAGQIAFEIFYRGRAHWEHSPKDEVEKWELVAQAVLATVPQRRVTAEDVWRFWYEGMTIQGRAVSIERSSWEDLPDREKALDDFIANRLNALLAQAQTDSPTDNPNQKVEVKSMDPKQVTSPTLQPPAPKSDPSVAGEELTTPLSGQQLRDEFVLWVDIKDVLIQQKMFKHAELVRRETDRTDPRNQPLPPTPQSGGEWEEATAEEAEEKGWVRLPDMEYRREDGEHGWVHVQGSFNQADFTPGFIYRRPKKPTPKPAETPKPKPVNPSETQHILRNVSFEQLKGMYAKLQHSHNLYRYELSAASLALEAAKDAEKTAWEAKDQLQREHEVLNRAYHVTVQERERSQAREGGWRDWLAKVCKMMGDAAAQTNSQICAGENDERQFAIRDVLLELESLFTIAAKPTNLPATEPEKDGFEEWWTKEATSRELNNVPCLEKNIARAAWTAAKASQTKQV